MKIKIITVLFFCSFTPLFAENQIRWDLGISGLMIPFSPDEDFYYTGDESWNIESDEIAQGYAGAGGPILPIGDIGVFGQFNFGKWRIGVGIRDISVLLVFNILYPLAYIEADAGPATFNFQVGGGVIGAMSLFVSFYLAGPYILPEASVWLRFSDKFRLGGGVLVGITPKIADDDIEKYLKNFTIGFLGFKYIIQKPWL